MALIGNTSVTQNALQHDYSQVTVAELRRRVVLAMATDRTWDGAGTSQAATAIRVPDIGTDDVETTDITYSVAASRAKADRDWAAGEGITSAQVILQQNLEARKVSTIGRLDAQQSPIDELEKERRDIVGQLARSKEDELAKYIDGLTTTTNVVPVAADYPQPNGSGSNGNGGKVFTQSFGAAASRINPDGTTQNAAARKHVTNILKRARLIMTKNNYLRGGGLDSMGDRNDMVYAFMAPELAQIVLDDIEESRNFSTSLTENVLGLDDGGPRINGSNAYEGTYRGIHIMTSTNPALLATSAKPWPVWVLSARGIAWTDGPVLTQILTPDDNQGGPRYSIRQVQEYGFQLVQRAAVLKFTIVQKA